MSQEKKFVAINYIHCEEHYHERFEQLFGTRAHAIDRMPGFVDMQVLKPHQDGDYLIISHWETEDAFKTWTSSPEFLFLVHFTVFLFGIILNRANVPFQIQNVKCYLEVF